MKALDCRKTHRRGLLITSRQMRTDRWVLLHLIHSSCCGGSAALRLDDACPKISRRKAVLGSLGVVSTAVLSPAAAKAAAAAPPPPPAPPPAAALPPPPLDGEVLRWSDAFLFIDRSRWRCVCVCVCAQSHFAAGSRFLFLTRAFSTLLGCSVCLSFPRRHSRASQ